MTLDERKPFLEWMESLPEELRKTVRIRLRRAESGTLGDVKPEGEGVLALRIHTGKGYRIYFAPVGNRIVLLLAGGDKSTQERDIRNAKAYWKDYRQRHTDDRSSAPAK